MSRTPVLEMRNIAKTFGNFHALKGVDLTVFPGEIHALMGENGAGRAKRGDKNSHLEPARDPQRRTQAGHGGAGGH